MTKTAKVAIILLVVFLIVILITVYTLPRLIDTEKLKSNITQAIEMYTGQQLTILGDLRLSLYPGVSLEIGDLELKYGKVPSRPSIANAESMVLAIELLPLLQGALSVKHVTLEGLKINLINDNNGENNWEDIITALQQSNLDIATIGRLTINDAAVIWQSNPSGRLYTISDLSVSTGKLVKNRSLRIKSNFNFINGLNQVQHNVLLTGYITPDLNLQRFEFNHTELTIKPYRETQVAEEVSDIGFVIETGEIDLVRQTLSVPSWRVNLFKAEIQGDISGTAILEHPEFYGAIKTSSFNLREVAEQLGFTIYATYDSSAFTDVSIKSEYSVTPDSFTANNLHMRLDDNILSGFFAVDNFDDPAVDFSFDLNRTTAESYLPLDIDDLISDIALQKINGLDIRGVLNVDTLKIANLTTRNNKFVFLAENGLLQLTRFNSIIHGGKLEGWLSLDMKTGTPVFAGYINLIGLNPRLAMEEWQKKPLKTPYIDALHRLDLSFNIDADENGIRLRGVSAKLDKSHGKGDIDIESLVPFKLSAKLDIDAINVDHYVDLKQIMTTTLFKDFVTHSSIDIGKVILFGRKCENVEIKTVTTPDEHYSIMRRPLKKKSKTEEIEGDDLTALLIQFVNSRCLESNAEKHGLK